MASASFRCPKCDDTVCSELVRESNLVCPRCESVVTERIDDFSGSGLVRCQVCGGKELFVRKDFPQRLGVTIVFLGFAASCVTWYSQWIVATFAVLFGTAFVDVVLYVVMGNVLECYQCHAQYRDIPRLNDHEAFQLEIHERHRQQSARLKRQSIEPALSPSQRSDES